MRKETRAIAVAFVAGKSCRQARTTTDGHSVFLHGNMIAAHLASGRTMLTLAGWNTVTTRDRVNGILDVMGSQWRVGTKKGRNDHYSKPYVRHYITGETLPLDDREWFDAYDPTIDSCMAA